MPKRDTGILQRTERFMVRALCGVQLKDKKRTLDVDAGLKLNCRSVGYSKLC